MCSFCGKSCDDPEVRKLISGPAVYICDGCISVCNGILDRELGKDGRCRLADIRRTLNQYLIGLYRACLEWFQERVIHKLPFLRSARTQHEEEPMPSPTSFTLRYNAKYTIEISLGSYQCLVSNTTIKKQMEAFGFCYVNVVGAGRNRTAEATWLNDNAKIVIRGPKVQSTRANQNLRWLSFLRG